MLVRSAEYNARGEAYKIVAPAGREDRVLHDDAGRVIRTIENYVDGDPSTGSSDEDVTVATTYGQIRGHNTSIDKMGKVMVVFPAWRD